MRNFIMFVQLYYVLSFVWLGSINCFDQMIVRNHFLYLMVVVSSNLFSLCTNLISPKTDSHVRAIRETLTSLTSLNCFSTKSFLILLRLATDQYYYLLVSESNSFLEHSGLVIDFSLGFRQSLCYCLSLFFYLVLIGYSILIYY